MKEIDRLLKQWIPVNTIIREEVRAAIMKYVQNQVDKAYESGVEAGLDYKTNTNTKG